MQDASATTAWTFSEANFRLLAARGLYEAPPAALSETDPGGPSDFDLNQDLLPVLARLAAPRPAAVLVPIVRREELTVLLTLRTPHLPSHAGQISFPGGKMEDGDASPLATALREAREEIGLEERFVEPLGYLDAYRTGTGFRIIPVVGLVDGGFNLSLDANEVAEAFEVPLAFLMDERNHRTHVRSWQGAKRHYHAMPFEQRYIWGATAGIMKNMHQRLLSP